MTLAPILCGNGTLKTGEECDDGNNLNGDDCSAACKLEVVTCGNGVLEVSDACDDGNTSDGDGCSAICQLEQEGICPLSQGFWKTRPRDWPVNQLTLGSQSYSQEELLALLKTPVGSGKNADASLILATQLIATKLNLADGADASPISGIPIDADTLLSSYASKLPYKVKPSSATGQAMTTEAEILRDYNEGVLTPTCTAE